MNSKSMAMGFFVALVLFCGASGAPEKKGPVVITDPVDAGPDGHLQGEYVGSIAAGTEIKVGLQVRALGDGKFEALGYTGGLPGDGWDPTQRVRTFKGAMTGNAAVFADTAAPHDVLTIERGLAVFSTDGKPIGTLKRIVRESKTLGMKPPEGAIVLFDGTSAENFFRGEPRWDPAKYQKAVMTEDKLLAVGRPHGGHVFSKQKFQSCTLHLEFRLAYMPEARGQGRSNSGCYVQGRYEVQILDSFALPLASIDTGDCGGIYSVSKPRLNMCTPPLTWQTFDIEFTAGRFDDAGKKIANPRMTVRHNGVLIHEDVEIDRPGGTTAAPYGDSPEPGILYLQDHGSPLRYRNIWVVPK